MIEPRIETPDLKLVGVGAIFKNIAEENVGPVLMEVWSPASYHQAEQDPPAGEHEVWIPITPRSIEGDR